MPKKNQSQVVRAEDLGMNLFDEIRTLLRERADLLQRRSDLETESLIKRLDAEEASLRFRFARLVTLRDRLRNDLANKREEEGVKHSLDAIPA